MLKRGNGYRPGGRAIVVMMGLAAWWAVVTFAAEPAPPESAAPERPSLQETVPKPAPPSTMDPGIQKQPPTVPSPESAVQPPVVDPKMAVDPERTPPASQPNIPKEPQAKPPPPRR